MEKEVTGIELSETEKLKLTKICREVTGKRVIKAACVTGMKRKRDLRSKIIYDILLILDKYFPRLNFLFRELNSIQINILLVDAKLFEMDVEKGILGGSISERLVHYYPLINQKYLRNLGIKLKKRLIIRQINGLISAFPELSRELLIKDDFFIRNIFLRKSNVFPSLFAETAGINMNGFQKIREDYQEAINSIIEERILIAHNGWLKINRDYIQDRRDVVKRIKSHIDLLSQEILGYSLGPLPNIPSIISNIIKTKDFGLDVADIIERRVGDQDFKEFIMVPLNGKLIPLSENLGIEEFIKKRYGEKYGSLRKIRLGSVLNSVYLLELPDGKRIQRLVAKKFHDWSTLKWLPIALWTLGTKNFLLSGGGRLEREVALNLYLSRRGFPVPEIIHVSFGRKILFMEFIEGESFVKTVKSTFSSEGYEYEKLRKFREVGRLLAYAHRMKVSLGDCKPENFIVHEKGRIYFVDLEQASRNGDYAWDIAEFLYYSGHYISISSPSRVIEEAVREFIEGYIEGGGRIKEVKDVSSFKFIKVFSLFTPPHIVFKIAGICKNLPEN